jgi:hypothetical protein
MKRTARIQAFFDPETWTVSYVVSDPGTASAAVIDPVLGYDFNSGHTHTQAADQVLAYLAATGLNVQWILETQRARRPSVGRSLPAGSRWWPNCHWREHQAGAGGFQEALQPGAHFPAGRQPVQSPAQGWRAFRHRADRGHRRRGAKPQSSARVISRALLHVCASETGTCAWDVNRFGICRVHTDSPN